MTKLDAVGDKVYVSYDTQVGRGRIAGVFVDRENINTDHMDLCYEYPFQWSNTDNKIKHHLFVLPIDEADHARLLPVLLFGTEDPDSEQKPIPRACSRRCSTSPRSCTFVRFWPKTGRSGRGAAWLQHVLRRADCRAQSGSESLPAAYDPQVGRVSGGKLAARRSPKSASDPSVSFPSSSKTGPCAMTASPRPRRSELRSPSGPDQAPHCRADLGSCGLSRESRPGLTASA